jgi:hypothetical protein
MHRHDLTGIAVAAAVLTLPATHTRAQEFIAKLSGFNEIGSIPSGASYTQSYTGAVLSNGSGTAKLHLNQKAGTIDYTLTYSDVGTTPPNTGNVSQAHIHFGKSRDSGGVIVFFCGTTATPGPAGTPTCRPHTGTVTGTWTPASVVGPAAQNIAAGNFDGLVEALTSNTAYANIHTVPAYPGGEIRGQVRSKEEEERHERQR